MLHEYDKSKLELYSLKSLFYIYKDRRDDAVLFEIYRRTHDYIFEFINPKVSSAFETSAMVVEVYRKVKLNLSRREKEQCVYAYLTRLADGCLITCSYS